jgi:hypothetical protein
VTVYPDDNNKPAVGHELNIPARITLLAVYPIDRSTREEIFDTERIKAMNYREYLREVTKKFDGDFVDYGITDGSWTFMVNTQFYRREQTFLILIPDYSASLAP